MRFTSVLAVGMVLLAGTAVRASGNGIFGVDPSKIQYKIIDTKNAIAPVPIQTRPTRFKLSDYLPSFLFNFGKPTVGVSNFPSPADAMKAVYYRNPYRKN